jgi:type I restriction enzyme R subunit
MPSAHTEAAFEAYIEQHLLEHGGYRTASPDDYDRKRALLPNELFSFIEATQPKVWQRLHAIHNDKLEEMLLDGLCKALDQQGSLAVIRHGLKFYGQTVRLAFFAPGHSLNPEVEVRYKANRLTVVRQLKYDLRNENSIDIVLPGRTTWRSTRRAPASPTPSPGWPTGSPRCTTTRTGRSTTPWWC